MNTKLAILILKEAKTMLMDASAPNDCNRYGQKSKFLCSAIYLASNYYGETSTPASLARYSPATLRRTARELRAWIAAQLGEVISLEALVLPLIQSTTATQQIDKYRYSRHLAYRIRLDWVDSMITELETSGERFLLPVTDRPLVRALDNNGIITGQLTWASGVAPEFSPV